MQRIGIERYTREVREAVEYAGLIEGTRDDGSQWIMWLDERGAPDVFWAHRDESGGVVGEPINLQ